VVFGGLIATSIFSVVSLAADGYYPE